METIEKSVEILDDLISVNNDRIECYERAFNDLEDNDFDLKTVFQGYREESIRNVVALTAEAKQLGDPSDHGTSAGGALTRAWVNIKTAVTGNSKENILNYCEQMEDTIRRAYNQALGYDSGLSPELRPLITKQEEAIFMAHDKIKGLRVINAS